MYDVVITQPAEADIRAAYEWWREHRSADEAQRWYENILPAIESLQNWPEACPPAPETDLHSKGLRQLHFGVGRRATHRIVFTIEDSRVVILRVRHTAQRELRLRDLPGLE